MKKFCVIMLVVSSIYSAGCANMQLAKDGETSYEIVKPAQPTEVDNYAMSELYNLFKQKTGAALAVAEPDKISPDRKHIFVGLSEPALKILGENPLDGLKDQEYVARNDGDSIFLYGKGLHGNLYAVVDFMENTLGCRLCGDNPVFILTRDLNVKPFERKGGFSFAYRSLATQRELTYQNGMNMGFSERNAGHKIVVHKDLFPSGVKSLKGIPIFVHTSFSYIPPNPESIGHKDAFDWMENKNYFKTNPEFFTQNEAGKRVPDRQLCFSNPGLRKELTKNILKHISLLTSEWGSDLIITLDQNDSSTGSFCYCQECQALGKKYQSPGGPLYDYLFDVCAVLQKEYPSVMLKILAYRRAQTQKPPVLPEGRSSFPENLIVVFCNVEDMVDVDWTNPVNHSTYEDLVAWKKLTPHLWTWYYYMYCSGILMPFNNIDRLANDLRMMKTAGVEGVFFELMAWDGGMAEVTEYVFCKLTQDVNRNVQELLQEFTEAQYGPAASMALAYINELGAASKTAKEHFGHTHTTIDFERYFTYLTPDNIWRWQGYFDQMNKVVATDARYLKNINRLRRNLDYATLGRWNDLAKAYPDYFRDHSIPRNRLGIVHRFYTGFIEDCELMIKTGGIQKPLPSQFDGIDKASIRRYVPVNGRNGTKQRIVLDSDAAFGYGATVDVPDLPFNFGFYQNDKKVHGVKVALASSQIKPAEYCVYKLGEIEVTQDCIIWFSSKSWATSLQLGSRLYEPGEPTRWEAYVSLKFDGPSYGGKAKEDLALCDQIILVRKK